jgi:phage terminase small subunit
MGRNKTPTAILDAKGAFIINPQRSRPNEPTSDRPLGSPPKYLSKEHKKIWKEIAKRLPLGVLLETDRDAFEMMVRLTYKMRNETAEAPMMAAERSTLISLWSRFAMTPADRSRVMVDKPKESKLSAFMKRKNAPSPAAEDSIPTVN